MSTRRITTDTDHIAPLASDHPRHAHKSPTCSQIANLPTANVQRRPVLGGLINEYTQAA